MKNKKNLDYIYKQNLEESIIEYLSKERNLEMRQAMDIYYHRRLAKDKRGNREIRGKSEIQEKEVTVYATINSKCCQQSWRW